ncbi:hypothetical protein [Tenacibaculum crassostreae]|uniref:hypothetical protein n=1 Tax=Tenacibaculum crassostreae TaxID=502683 RepID=UPI003893B0CA
MLKYNLIQGAVTIEDNTIKTDKISLLNSIKWKFLSLIGALYIYDRIEIISVKELSFFNFSLKVLFYSLLSFFVFWSIYYYWIKIGFIKNMKIENLSKILISVDEDTPLNILVRIKGKINSIDLTFRKSENDLDNFLNELKKRNSRFTIKDKRT